MSHTIAAEVIDKALAGERLTREDGIQLYALDLPILGTVAQAVRRRLHPEPVVTFVVDRVISYTNVCVADCDFCAFYRTPLSPEGYTWSKEDILQKVKELIDIGGTQVMLQGGLNPKLPLAFYEDILRAIRQQFDVHLHCFSPTEIDFFAKLEKTSLETVLRRLQAAGMDSLPGGGAEILVDRVRQILSPKKLMSDRWLEVMRVAAQVGMQGSATMVIGHVETIEERIEHLLRLREVQDDTGVFRSFIPWTMSTHDTRIKHLHQTGADDYLKTIAIARLFLDNIPNIQTGWVTEGPKVAQVALAFGANDMGGVILEESVISQTGLTHEATIREFVRLIERAGFTPAQRNTNYDILKYLN